MEIVRVINRIYNSNTFILSLPYAHNVCLIDVGDADSILELLKPEKYISHILLTHTHYDHIYGIVKILNKFPACNIYTSSFGVKGLMDDKINFSKYHNDSIIYQGTNVLVLKEGDSLNLFPGIDIKVFETPGHDPSCLSYVIDNNIFSGDSYIPGINVVATFPNSNKANAQISRDRIRSISINNNLYPGHGPVFLNYYPKDNI